MDTLQLKSFENPLIKEYRRLSRSRKQRRSLGKLALEGPRLLQEALSSGLVPETVFFTCTFRESAGGALLAALPKTVKQAELPEALFTRLAGTEAPQGVAAVVPYREAEPSYPPAKPYTVVLLLDRLQDPGNMGTVLRTAVAAGVKGVFYTTGSVDPYSPKVLRATAGALFHLSLAAAPGALCLLEGLKAGGFQVVASLTRAKKDYWAVDFREPTVLIIGNESSGISPGLASLADTAVSIPQAGSPDSLNAAVAAAVILYEALRQRGAGR